MTEPTLTHTAPEEGSSLAGDYAALGVLAAGLAVFAAAAPTSYQLYLMIHLFAAAVWVGGGATIAMLAFLVVRQRDPVMLGRFAGLAGQVGMRVYLPSSLVVLAFGFVLVSKGSWGYGHFWVVFALLGWAATFVTGAFYLGPTAKKLAVLAPARDPGDAEVQGLIRRIILVDRWQTLLLLLVIADMAAKPFS
jgi:uncharacterized membrane protein